MSDHLIKRTESAYGHPLLVCHLLSRLAAQHADQEIVYAGTLRFSYAEFRERVLRLAEGFQSIGVGPGDTVAVMDWDSHRYLECFFAVPMVGAVLHTINIRLAPEQILYTVNHAKDTVILVHDDFAPLLKNFEGQTPTIQRVVRLTDSSASPVPEGLRFDIEYEIGRAHV